MKKNNVKIYCMKNEKYTPVILATLKCNRKCIFCLRSDDSDPPHSITDIKNILNRYKDTITIEGGEPTLSKRLEYIIKLAKSSGAREVILMTNAYLLDNYLKIKRIINNGVDIFSINFPSHIEKLFNILTQTKGQYKKNSFSYKKNIKDITRKVKNNMCNKLN
ncbi:MAG: radical SAM protein [Elusimicrobiota bacterium]